MKDDVAQRIFEAIAAGRLLVFCGAGLSMSTPSSLPSARQVADACAETYKFKTGHALPAAILGDIEKIAKYFSDEGRFDFFVDELVPWPLFKRESNAGHECVADLLICKVFDAGVTTNFDTLVENAASALGEKQFEPIIDKREVARATTHAPYLKLHGCMTRDHATTIWHRDQLSKPDIAATLDKFIKWLQHTVMGKDILFVGFWTDWAYLTEVLAENLASVSPQHVYVVDPVASAQLELKAPLLWKWAHGPGITFHHIEEKGADFLDELRQRWSRVFLSQLVQDSVNTYRALFGSEPKLPSHGTLGSQDLYALRRDLTGTPRTSPVRARRPDSADHVAAAIHSRLIEAGAAYSEHRYVHGRDTVRLISGKGRVLSAIRADFQYEPPMPGIEKVICASAREDLSPPHLVRPIGPPTLVRPGSHADWHTDAGLLAALRAK